MLIEIEPARKNASQMKNYTYYQAENGTFLYIHNFLYEALIKKELKDLGLIKLEENIKLNLEKKIPYTDIKKIEAFFRNVRLLYNREALIIPMFHPIKKEFDYFIPHQTAGPAFVISEEAIIERDGFIPYGTIHSHPGHPFHSNGDIEDEKNNASGLHLTVGNLEKEQPDWVASLVVHGKRVQLNPEDVIELKPQYPKEWIFKISQDITVEGICAPYLKLKK